MRVPKAIKEGDESHRFLEFLYICNVFTKLDDLIRPKSITQAQKRIKKPKLTFPLIGQDFPTVHRGPSLLDIEWLEQWSKRHYIESGKI